MSTTHLFCFGYGYTARRLAARLLTDGWRVTGTTRSVPDESHSPPGLHMLQWDGTTKLPDDALQGVTHVLVSIPPDADGDIALRHCAEQLAACATLQWVAYLSTTGVYGDHDGAWVDETTPTNPATRRSQWRAQAEQGWLDWGAAHDTPVQIFRLPAIYGPYRNPLSKLLAGNARRIDVPDIVFSRIHVDDIVSTLRASMAQPHSGAIYNVADDLPEASATVTTYAAELLGVTPPPLQTLQEADLSPLGRSFYQSSRRVRNDKIKQKLGIKLTYPDYRVGLKRLYENGEY